MGLRELNIDFTKEHVTLWTETKKFLSEVWRPAAIELDQMADPADVIAEGSVLWEVMRKTNELGYHGMAIPEEFGGMEMDPLGSALIAELMGWAAPDLAVSWGVNFTPYAYAMYSPEPSMQELTRQFCADKEGKMTGCWAITEPDHGSDWIMFDGHDSSNPDVAAQVRAVLDGDEYVITGQKSAWVSNGTFAKYAALWVCLDPSKGMDAGGVAIIPLDLPGIRRGKPLNKMGQRALNQGEIFFDNVRIPRYMMVAEDPDMYKFFSTAQLGLANAWMGLTFTGCAQAALEEALQYAQTRVQGGKAIMNHQNVKLKIFDMFASVEAARSLARRVSVYNSNQLDQMKPPAVHYSMASKVLATETAFRVASQGIQIFGGYGLSKEYLIEKIFRDARAAMIEDGSNDVLSIDAAERLQNGRNVWTVSDENTQAAQPEATQGEGPSWEEMEPILRPKGVRMGVMEVDPDVCSQCGNCILNCPFKCWEETEDGTPKLKEEYECFSCYNCMVACEEGAITIKEPYNVTEGFFKSDPYPLPAKTPLRARDADGNAEDWNPTERLIFERRSVRNFNPDPVPDHMIRRVLEAGRFAPSGGNCQPWKFIVITDKTLIAKMDESCKNVLTMLYNSYKNDAMVKMLIPMYEQRGEAGLFDPRIIMGGAGSIAREYGKVFLDAPVVILIACDDRAIGGPQISAGICGQSMNLAAQSLDIGFCWIGFSQLIEMDPPLKEELGLAAPWTVCSAAVLGYPDFNQKGIVPREFRPVTWFREGAAGPEIEEG